MALFNSKFFSIYKRQIIIIFGLLILLILSLFLINTVGEGHKKFLEHGFFNSYTLIVLLAFSILTICLLAYYLISNIRSTPSIEDQEQSLKIIEKQKNIIIASIKRVGKTLKSSGRLIWTVTPYKYKLPWYLICGAPQSGKSTLINGSGLRIPLKTMSNKNIELFEGSKIIVSDSAILIDSSGPFLEPEKLQLWEFFISRLKRFRPVQPINGILLVLDVEVLKHSTQTRLSALALELRDHLLQLQNSIDVTPPIYLIFTKIDKLFGFNSFFKGSPAVPTNQILGLTLPLAKDEEHQTDVSFLNKFDKEYNDLIQWQLPRMLERTSQEFLPKSRFEAYMFLIELMSLKKNLAFLLDKGFSPSEIDDKLLLRGVYFVNGIPLSSGNIQDASKREDNQQFEIHTQQYGLFIKDLFEKLIFNESGLVGFNENAKNFLSKIRMLVFGITVSIFIGFITWMVISYFNNNALIDKFSVGVTESSKQLDNYVKKISVRYTQGQIAWTLPFLESLRDLPAGWYDLTMNTPFSERAGLSQRNLLSQAAIAAYTTSLEHLLLPRVYDMLEVKLTNPQTPPAELYENLMVYLMLSDVHAVDKKIAFEVLSKDFSDRFPGIDYEILRNQFSQNITNLLEIPFSPMPKDHQIIISTRNKLKDYSPSQRGFNLLAQLPEVRDLPQLRSQDALGPLGSLAIKRRSGGSLYFYIPGMYSASGLSTVVLGAIPKVADTIAQEDWVLFNSTENAIKVKAQRKDKLADEIRSIYVKNYIETWDKIINDIDFVSFADFKQEYDLLQSLIGPPSPLESIITAIARETTTAPEQSKSTDKPKEPHETLDKLSDILDFDNKKARNYINDHYSYLHNFVKGSPSGLSELLKGLTSLKMLIGPIVAARGMLSTETGKMTTNNPLEQTLNQLQGLAIGTPTSIEDAINTLIRQTTILIETAAKSNVESEWKENIYKFCQRSVNNRFPFTNNREEVALNDFIKVFAPDGLIDQFFSRYIKSYVDDSSSPWKLHTDTNTKLEISQQALHFFEQASWIKKVFFPAGSKEPRISFGLTPSDLDIKAKGVTIDVGGQSLSYAYGSQQTQTMLWPNGNNNVRVNFANTDINQTKSLSLDGPWALFRLIQMQKLTRLSPTRFELDINFSGRYANFIIEAATVDNPFYSDLLHGFRCLSSLVN